MHTEWWHKLGAQYMLVLFFLNLLEDPRVKGLMYITVLGMGFEITVPCSDLIIHVAIIKL
jgi:hypothetical protein